MHDYYGWMNAFIILGVTFFTLSLRVETFAPLPYLCLIVAILIDFKWGSLGR